MPNLRYAIRDILRECAQRAEHLQIAKGLRFAWAEGIRTLYKFKPLDNGGIDHVRDMIENSRLYLSTQAQLNDPEDCAPIFQLAGDPHNDPAFMAELKKDEDQMIRELHITPEAEAELRKHHGTHVDEMAATITRNVRDELRRTLHIFCLTSELDNRLMWTHYAAGHTGVALHFDVIPGTLTGLARGIDYVAKLPPVLVPLRFNANDGDDAARIMSLIKTSDYSYESEYRILGNPDVDWGYPMDGQFVSFPSRLLTGITLGLRISAANRDLILQWCRERTPPIPVWEAYEDPATFEKLYRQIG
jgi:hypothetical protein